MCVQSQVWDTDLVIASADATRECTLESGVDVDAGATVPVVVKRAVVVASTAEADEGNVLSSETTTMTIAQRRKYRANCGDYNEGEEEEKWCREHDVRCCGVREVEKGW